MIYRAVWAFVTPALAAQSDHHHGKHVKHESKHHKHHHHSLHHHLQKSISATAGGVEKWKEGSGGELPTFRAGDLIDQDAHVHYEVIRFLGKGEYGTVYEAYRCSTSGHDFSQDWINKPSMHHTADRSQHVCDRHTTVAVKLLTKLEQLEQFKKVFPLADEWSANRHLVQYALNNSISFNDLGNFPMLSHFDMTSSSHSTSSAIPVIVFPKGTPTRKATTYSLNRIHCMSRDLLVSLHHLQAAGYAHRDVKPNNVFGWNGRFVLGDLSFAVKASRKQTKGFIFDGFVMAQDLSWMRRFAPEFRKGFARRPEMDTWALGCSLFEMVFDDFLVFPTTSGVTSARGLEKEQEHIEKKFTTVEGRRSLIPQRWMEDLQQLPASKRADELTKADRFLEFLQGMMIVDPDHRHLPGQLLQHPYLSDAAQVCDLSSARGPGRVDPVRLLAHENALGIHTSGSDDAATSDRKHSHEKHSKHRRHP